MGFCGRVCGEAFINFLEFHNVALAIPHHLCHSTWALLKEDVFPHSVFRFQLACPRQDLSQIVEAVGVEIEATASPLKGVKALGLRPCRNIVHEGASPNPRKIKAVPVVEHHLIGFSQDVSELFQHLTVVLVLVPCKTFGTFGVLPFVANANDASLVDDVVVGDVLLVSRPPEQSNVGAGFNVCE